MAAATQTRILAGMEDVAAVRFRCSDPTCGHETVHRVDRKPKPETLPMSCPYCGAAYYVVGTPESQRREHLILILLAELRRLQREEESDGCGRRPMRVILEIDPGA